MTTTTSTTAEAEFAAGSQRLGLAAPDVAELVELRRAGDCTAVQRRMSDLVADQIAQAQPELAEQGAAGASSMSNDRKSRSQRGRWTRT